MKAALKASISPQRSANMAAIGSRNTRPEIAVRKVLHGLGFRFRLHTKNLPGTPDIVLPKHRAIILVHGCFWHRHAKCRFAYTPKTRKLFWENKFKINVLRDRKVRRLLRKLGWNVQTVWECQTRDPEKLAQRILLKLGMQG